jgi:hypothetical protein
VSDYSSPDGFNFDILSDDTIWQSDEGMETFNADKEAIKLDAWL